ncbi:MAG: methyltransferase domain-containing protein [Desertimonas sp.]
MATLDRDRLIALQLLVFSKLEGAMTAAMIHLGDELGLYRALAGHGPMTTSELAERVGLEERWVREWAYNQGAARVIDATVDGEVERFSLSAEGAAVLADPESDVVGLGMFRSLPETMSRVRDLPQSFRSGIGFDYDAHGLDGLAGLELSFEPWTRKHLVPDVLPHLDGVEDALRCGGAVADVGCGPGGAALTLAAAFPACTVTGYDISRLALERAAARAATTGLDNVSFRDPRVDPLPTDRSLSLVLTLDCVHDMTDPQTVMAAIREAVADDGVWLLVDIKAADTFAGNVERNPMAALMYGISVVSCMSSALSEPAGAGLGTLGLSAARAEAMARQAGFTRFRRLDVDHGVNAFYEIRP